MKELRIPMDRFDFDRFLSEFRAHAEQVINPDYALAYIDDSGDVPEYVGFMDRVEIIELLEDNKLVFIFFSETNLGEPVACIDGMSYEVNEELNFIMGENDCVGFLFQKEGNHLIIHSAMNTGGACVSPPPSVFIEADCSIFDPPMEQYLQRFVLA